MDPVDGWAAATADVATDAVLLPASSMVPPMPKNDATLRPARKMRDARARWRRRAGRTRASVRVRTGWSETLAVDGTLAGGGPALLESAQPFRLVDRFMLVSHRNHP